MMRSLDVSRCVGDISKPSVNTTNMNVCGTGKRKVFEAVASCCAGDPRFAVNLVQTQSEILMSSIVGCVTDLGNNGCDDLRARFWSEQFGGCFKARCVHAW